MFCWRMKNESKLFVWQFWIVAKKICPSFLGLLSLFVSAAGANMVATLNSAVYCVTCIVLGIFLPICSFFSLNDLNLTFNFPFVSFVTKFQQSKSTVSMVKKWAARDHFVWVIFNVISVQCQAIIESNATWMQLFRSLLLCYFNIFLSLNFLLFSVILNHFVAINGFFFCSLLLLAISNFFPVETFFISFIILSRT